MNFSLSEVRGVSWAAHDENLGVIGVYSAPPLCSSKTAENTQDPPCARAAAGHARAACGESTAHNKPSRGHGMPSVVLLSLCKEDVALGGDLVLSGTGREVPLSSNFDRMPFWRGLASLKSP